jgi:hypothetical protein
MGNMAKRKSIRERLSPALLMDLADVFEQHGRFDLRKVIDEDPALFLDVASQVLSPQELRRMGNNPTDADLDLIVSRHVASIRVGTPAEGKPVRGMLH